MQKLRILGVMNVFDGGHHDVLKRLNNIRQAQLFLIYCMQGYMFRPS